MNPQLPDSNPIIVLEAGATHNGEIGQALEMIRIAADSGGVDAIKFQTVWAGNLTEYRKGSLDYRDSTGTHRRSILDMLKSREFSWYLWEGIDKYAIIQKLMWFSTPDTPATAKTLGNLGSSKYQFSCCGIKIAGSDMGRTDLIAAATYTGLRVLLDTKGGEDELEAALEICQRPNGAGEYSELPIIVHTPTGYPTVDPHLERITELVKQYPNHVIGFTSHSPGTEDCTKALAAGAGYIEKGITLDRKQPGIEHLMCLEPSEVKEFVDKMREN